MENERKRLYEQLTECVNIVELGYNVIENIYITLMMRERECIEQSTCNIMLDAIYELAGNKSKELGGQRE